MITATHLMMMDPPRTGDDFGVPGSAVAHGHGAGLCQGAGRDGIAWAGRWRGGEEQERM